ncbi:cytochrome P450 2J2-like isoform X1 [Asterias amurensis]|uniref:cytochrome P450 2J2-like isoform X1 n=1 Tax=Asterias amurensis TaxID=7602 RepID=UPI003AB1289D
MDLAFVICCAAAVLAFIFFVKKSLQGAPPNYPPIPNLLPVLWDRWYHGVDIGDKPHEIFHWFYPKLGPIYMINGIVLKIFVIHGAELIREAFHNRLLCDRPSVKIVRHTVDGEGVAFSSGDAWKAQRRIAITFMKDFGLNRTDYGDVIGIEAECLVAEMKKQEGEAFDPYILLANAVSNIICKAVYGKRYDYDDPNFKRLLRSISRNIQLIGGMTGFLQILPGAHWFARFLPPVRELGKNLQLIGEFTAEIVKEHQKDFDGEHPRDFIDVYLKEMAAATGDERSNIRLNDMYATVGDLFIAGTEATSTTVRWGMLYMMANPEIQQKIQHEMDRVVGRDREPRMSDSVNLPYTQACISEIFRLGNVVPLGAPHRASQDTVLGGYHVPKGSIVFANIGAIGLDPEKFSEPERFNPERFLDEGGKVIKGEGLIPFSTGHRMCIGEQMSKTEMFVFFTRLIHRFTFKKPEDSPPISFKAVAGVTLSPLPFKICAIPRDN